MLTPSREPFLRAIALTSGLVWDQAAGPLGQFMAADFVSHRSSEREDANTAVTGPLGRLRM